MIRRLLLRMASRLFWEEFAAEYRSGYEQGERDFVRRYGHRHLEIFLFSNDSAVNRLARDGLFDQVASVSVRTSKRGVDLRFELVEDADPLEWARQLAYVVESLEAEGAIQ